MAAILPRTPFRFGAHQKRPSKDHLFPAKAVQLLSQLFCSVPAQVHMRLGEWWFSRYRYPRVDKDLRVSDPALLVPEEPLGFFGC